jgi:hypothetical protein
MNGWVCYVKEEIRRLKLLSHIEQGRTIRVHSRKICGEEICRPNLR